MKKIILIFAISCLIINTLQAQSSFNEAYLKGLFARWDKDPISIFKNETDPNFTFINENGVVVTRDQLIQAYIDNKESNRSIENMKVWQVANTGIVTGILNTTILFKNDPIPKTFKEVFTYTFSQKNGKWLFASAQHTDYKYPAFSATTMKEILDEYKADSKAFFINRLSDDFRYIPRDGKFQNKEEILKGNKQNIVSTEMLQPVIFQSGDLAVTSGIHQTVRIDKDGKQVTSQVECTYTWQRRNGKWLFVASQQSVIQAPVEDDEVAIKSVLNAETVAFDNADYKTYLGYYSKAKYTSFLYSAGLFVGDDLWKKMDEVAATRKAQKVIRTRSNWNIRVNGASAFVTYNQVNEYTETSIKNESYEERFLEKTNGEWKIANTTVIMKK